MRASARRFLFSDAENGRQEKRTILLDHRSQSYLYAGLLAFIFPFPARDEDKVYPGICSGACPDRHSEVRCMPAVGQKMSGFEGRVGRQERFSVRPSGTSAHDPGDRILDAYDGRRAAPGCLLPFEAPQARHSHHSRKVSATGYSTNAAYGR